MKVYFTASLIGKRYHQASYEKIVELLMHSKHVNQVLQDHILKTSETSVQEESETARRAYHEQLKQWITSSDCVITETSYPSTGVGYEISYALSKRKPVLMLYKNTVTPPSLFDNYCDDLLICQEYTENNLAEIIDDFLSYVKGGPEKRFTFSLTPKIATFLNDMVSKEKMPKSVYIRKLIEKEMRKQKP